MTIIILKLLRPAAPYLAVLFLFLAAGLYVLNLQHNLAAANQKNITLKIQNDMNLAAIADYKTQQAKWNMALDALDAQMLNTNIAANQITAKINTAPITSDGLVAPVLAEALDSLRALQGNAP